MNDIDELERTYDHLLRESQKEVSEYLDAHRDFLKKHEVHAADFHLPLRPMFLSKEQVQYVEDSVRVFWGGLLEVYKQVFGGDLEKIVDFLETPRVLLPWLERCFSPELDVDQLFGRPDGFMWAGELKFIEQNITSGAGGMASVEAVVRFFDSFPVIEALRKQVAVDKLSPIASYASYFSGQLAGKSIGYVDAIMPDTGELFDAQGVLFVDRLEEMGVALSYLTHRPVQFREDGIHFDGKRIDCIYRGVAGIGLLGRLEELAPLFEACGRGVAEMVMSPYELIFFDKLLLPYLSDERENGFLSDGDRSVMASILPWTRFLRDYDTDFHGQRVNVPALCMQRKDDLVLKKGDGFGSNAVIVGAEHADDAWREAMAKGIAQGGWIVQEMVTPPTERMPFLEGGALVWTDLISMTCPYMLRGRVCGFASRTSIPRGSRVLVGAGVEGSQAGLRTVFRVG